MTFLRFFFSQGSRRASFVVPAETIFPAKAEHSAAFDDAEFLEVGTAARTGFGGRGPEREKLTDAGQKHWRLDFQISFSG